MSGEFQEELEDVKLVEKDAVLGTCMANHLEILTLRGKGGMSSVYKAKHLLLDRQVAVKVIQKNDPTALLRFKQEAKAATSLSHPNIAGVREFGINEQGNPYLVMDYVEGKTLSDLIKENGSLSTERTISIMSQICTGLDHAHKLNIVHRDLKPSNIIVMSTADGGDVVKIVDFGIAKIIEDEQSSVTQTGEIFGTPNYMSPEQGQGHPVDARTDIYSMGCMIFECLTGKPPFTGANPIEIILKHTNAEPPTLRSLKVVSHLDPVIQCCLAKDAANRYQNALELDSDLRANEPKAWTQHRSKKLSSKDRKKFLLVTLSAIALIGVLFIATIWPALRPIFFPKPWDKLSMAASGEAANGLSNYESAKSLMFRAIDAAENGGATLQEKELLYQQLAKLYSGSNDWKNAIRFFNKALELNATHAVNANTGSMHDWLSEAYIYDKEFDRAVEHASTAVQIKKRILGENHPYTLFALLHLGQAYRGAKQVDEAEKVDRQALSVAQKLYPAGDNVTLADAYHQLANILAVQGKSGEAAENYSKSLEISIKARGSLSPMVAKERKELNEYMKNLPAK